MRLTTHDTCVSTGQPSEPLTGPTLRSAADRVAEEQSIDDCNDSYYRAKEQLYRNLADLQESGVLREEILSGISAEAREVISQNPPADQLKSAVARLEVVIAVRSKPLYGSES